MGRGDPPILGVNDDMIMIITKYFSTNFIFKDRKGPFPPSEACRQLCLRVNLVHAGRHLSCM